MIRVHKAGLFTTVQDLGRYGYAHLGISPAGAADALSLRIANLLVGNEANAAALEMTLLGPTLEFHVSGIVALSGADCGATINSRPVPPHESCAINPGDALECGSISTGARSYLAVQGGFDVPLLMRSGCTDVRGRFGGFQGRRLQNGDMLPLRKLANAATRSLRPGALDRLRRDAPIRFTRGAQQDWFGADAFQTLYSAPYIVSDLWDRAGLRLKGEALRPQTTAQLLTDGIPLGAIQVPQDGQPIILFVDQQTTGGYPKIANVIAADLHCVGQLRPRQEIRFQEVSPAEAVAALRQQERWLEEIFR